MFKIKNMKKVYLLSACMMFLSIGLITGQKTGNEPLQNGTESVRISAAPEIEALTASWIKGFESTNPGMKAELLPPASSSQADIQFVTGNSLIPDESTNAWKMVVGRDVIVPVTSVANPFLNDLYGSGVSPEKFASLMSAKNMTWSKLFANAGPSALTVWLPADKAVRSSVARFVNTEPEKITASTAPSSAAMLEMLRKDPCAIGFCRLADVSDNAGRGFLEGFKVIPVDINNNGRSDYFEQFYNDYSSFSRGVYIGKYPKTLCNSIFAVSPSQPVSAAGTALLRYILVDGQQFLAGSGYSALADGEGLIRREALAEDQGVVASGNAGLPFLKAALWVIAIILFVSLLAYAVYRYTRSVNLPYDIYESAHSAGFSEKSLLIPGGVFFDRSHTWAFMEKDGAVRVGIDDFLQHVTGSITRVRMKPAGERVNKGDHIISLVQKGKQLDIQSPVSGTITARNEKLNLGTDIINNSPYNEGWIYSIKPDNWIAESRLMIMAGKYAEWIRDEFTRIKDFLAGLPGDNNVRYASVVLQDGGELKDGLLEEFGPEVWEEFQTRFIDASR
jgi:glycine cleavage system H lipoate-binding protein/ABC-type phosphate transport system substrate-binding protein